MTYPWYHFSSSQTARKPLALRMMIYPLVFCSLIAGIHSIGSVSATGRIGAQSVAYFTATTLFASLLGLFLPKA